MRFHLLKPLHGWRAFAGEVGIIVLGVLIALGADQAVEAWQWQQQVDIVRQSLMGELANDRARWEGDVTVLDCTAKDIARLDAWARSPGGSSAPAAESMDALWTMHSANWALATNSLTMDHFPMREQLAFAALYDGIAHRQKDIDKASDAFERIDTLVPLSADPRALLELREAIGESKLHIAALLGNTGYMQRHFDAVGVKADRSDFAADIPTNGCMAKNKLR